MTDTGGTALRSVSPTEILAYDVSIKVKPGFDKVRVSGSVQGQLKNYISRNHGNEFPDSEISLLEGRKSSTIRITGVPKKVIGEALQQLMTHMNTFGTEEIKPVPLDELSTEQQRAQLRRSEDNSSAVSELQKQLEVKRKELDTARSELTIAKSDVTELQSEVASLTKSRQELLVRQGTLEANIAALTERNTALQQAMTSKTTTEMPEDYIPRKLAQWVPVGEKVIQAARDIFDGSISVDELRAFAAIAPMSKFNYISGQLMETRGRVVKGQAELDALLERVPWSQSKTYTSMIGAVDATNAPERVQEREFVRDMEARVAEGKSIPQSMVKQFDEMKKRTDEEQKLLDEFEKRRIEYGSVGPGDKDLAVRLEERYNRAARLKELSERTKDEPPLPVYIEINRGQRSVEIRYPPLNPDGPIATMVVDAFKSVPSGEFEVRESSSGKLTVAMPKMGRYPTMNLAHEFHKALLDSELLQGLGLSVLLYSKFRE